MPGIIDRPEGPPRRVLGAALIVVAVAASLLFATRPASMRGERPDPGAPAGAVTGADRDRPAGAVTRATETPASTGFGAAIGFASPERLLEHFRKHGREFEATSPEDYLRIAQGVRDRALGDDVLEARRADGVITRFERSSGTFVAFDADGVLRTCFRPNEGEAYFHRQASRPAS